MNATDWVVRSLNLVAYAITNNDPQESIDIRIEHLIYRLLL